VAGLLTHNGNMIDGQPERTIVNPITDVDGRINDFYTAFSGLREDFRTKALIHTTLVLGRMELVQSQMASSVDLMRGYLQSFSHLTLPYGFRPECREVLKPEEMDPMDTFCVVNTRRNTINDIMAWTADDSTEAKKVLWVYGLAGTGKSTLSSTIAQNMHSLHRLGAFFLFNRDKPLRDSRTLIRTLAYRLADFDPCFRAAISPLVKQDSNITIASLEYQFQNMLIYALKSVEWSRGPIVLIIDALDECGREADRKDLMQALSRGFSDLPSFELWLLAGRSQILNTH
jgi:hypothetical protein